MSTEKYCIIPKLLLTEVSTESVCFIMNPLLSIPLGYVCDANRLPLHFFTMFVTSKLVSKLSADINCWVFLKSAPVYQDPPPAVNKDELIDPVVSAANICPESATSNPPCKENPSLPVAGLKGDWFCPLIELVVKTLLQI